MDVEAPPPRVLMTADAVGGVWTYAMDLARGLSSAGCEVILAVLGPRPSAEQSRAAGAASGVTVLNTGLELDWRAGDSEAIVAAGRWLEKAAEAFAVDIVHLNSPALAADARFRAPVLGVCHSCLATWWAAVKSGPMPADFVWRTEALRRGLLACGALIAPSRAFADATAGAYGIPRPGIVLNGRAPVASSISGRREPVVLGVGRLWDEGKNAAALDAAARRWGGRVRLAGSTTGPDGQSVQLAHAEAIGACGAEAVAREMTRAAIFASAALYEPFGLAVVEAAGAGCALVLSDIASHRELWDGAAQFADARRPEEFAELFDRLLGDEDERRVWAERARRRAARYTVERMTAGVLAAYGDLTRSPRGLQRAQGQAAA